MCKRKISVQEIIDIVTNADDSDLSELSEKEECDYNDYEAVSPNNEQSDAVDSNGEDSSDKDNSLLLSVITEDKKHVYRWQKRDVLQGNQQFTGEFSPPPIQKKTLLECFTIFFPESLLHMIVDSTNLYSVQKNTKSVKTSVEETKTYIGMQILMGVIKLPSYCNYWSGALSYPAIADVMSRNHFETLSRYLHFGHNDSAHDASNKLFKIRPILTAVWNECLKVEPEEYHSIDEQIIPSKTKYTKIRQYNPKKPRKLRCKNLVRVGASGFTYMFYLYRGKESQEKTPYSHLQKSTQVVAKLCVDLPRNVGHKVFFDNWFTTLDLMLYFKKEGILAVGTIRGNRIQGCPLLGNKEIEKGNRPKKTTEQWVKKDQARKEIPCPQIVKAYNKSMSSVDLADMLISLYRVEVITRRWYINVF